ncbi:hypothetical protein [Rhodohalobacter mucosus]|uniref:Uncharacterized protein n=1 Tax=Rhodohalobacter mucosus TaxID=2079485 RepID=A0A316TUI5_9BACT|nr:hypothetical protein [Rhodohalobacter mucosus]PWN07518.1 hypothetical protein DDZ15_04465 [Rhodohalobacter mucosus]
MHYTIRERLLRAVAGFVLSVLFLLILLLVPLNGSSHSDKPLSGPDITRNSAVNVPLPDSE